MGASTVVRGRTYAIYRAAGHPRPTSIARNPVKLPSGRPPRNKGLRYPADPPTVEEIIAVMRAAGDHAEAVRLRGLIVVLWRAGLRISEALALTESDRIRKEARFSSATEKAANAAKSAWTAGPGNN